MDTQKEKDRFDEFRAFIKFRLDSSAEHIEDLKKFREMWPDSAERIGKELPGYEDSVKDLSLVTDYLDEFEAIQAYEKGM